MDAVFLDIDGTVNVAVPEPGMTRRTRDIGYPIHATAEIVDWLGELHARGVALIWNTTWNDQAEDYAEWFGLPRGLPWVRHDVNRVSFGHSLKVRGAVRYLAEHPQIERAVVLDDVVGEYDAQLPAVTSGCLLIPALDDRHGITREVMDSVDAHLQPHVRV